MKRKTLVVIFQRGACDGLNTVIPFADPGYYQLRSSLAIPSSEIVPVTDQIGFHPNLSRLKGLYDQGLVYQGLRVLPYCWNDETPLSNHELRMEDEVYQVRNDPAVTVGLRLETGELALIWTTTPWTLPSNLAIMVRPDISYVVVESDSSGRIERYVLAEARVAAYARELFGLRLESAPCADHTGDQRQQRRDAPAEFARRSLSHVARSKDAHGTGGSE